jgi:hypothetical protein
MQFAKSIKAWDLFPQGVSLRVSKNNETMPSWAGLLFSLPVYVITIAYLVV